MKIDRGEVTRGVLTVLAIGGILALGAVAPNVVQLLKCVDGNRRKNVNRHYYIKQVVDRLEQRGLITYRKNHLGQRCVSLTNRGQKILQKYELDQLTIKQPRRWDGKYRVIIFDIKEWKRGTRNQLRHWLQHLGFVQLQQSVWVHPYDCGEVIVLLKSHFKLGKEVLFLMVESIENDRWLKQEFGLI